MSTPELKLENCWSFRTIQEWKKAAREAGKELDPEDYPNDAAAQRQRLQDLQAMAATEKDKQIVITSMSRQNVRTVDKDGKPTVKEYLAVRGEFQITTDRGTIWMRGRIWKI